MSITLPGPTLGVVGGGQLGRMLAEAAAPLGVEVIVLDPTPECPASAVARDQIVAAFDDPDGIRALAARADALTFEIELADPDVLAAASADHGVPVHPDPDTLETIQDKLVQTEALADAGIPVPEFAAVATVEGVQRLVEEFGGVMLKAREGGYDGRGNVPVHDPSAAADALAASAPTRWPSGSSTSSANSR
jgi:Phosphoribosylaminoimidazole carboxylase (NCAIR synthetase)